MNKRQQEMSLIYDGMIENLRPLTEPGSSDSEVDGMRKKIWNRFLIVLSYCFVGPERKDY